MPSEDSASAPEAHDLSQTVGKYLDRHMMLPLLDFLATKKVYPESELDAARLQARGGRARHCSLSWLSCAVRTGRATQWLQRRIGCTR
jgi:hypothetical protein